MEDRRAEHLAGRSPRGTGSPANYQVAGTASNNASLCACWSEDSGQQARWWRLGAASFLAVNAMVLSLALNASETTSVEQLALQRGTAFMTLAVLLLTWPFFAAGGKQALRERQFSLETLFLVGILAACAASLPGVWTPQPTGYFDVAALLLVVYSLGRELGSYSKRKILESWSGLAPASRRARVLRNGLWQVLPATEVRVGDRVRLMPGEAAPVDGILTSPGLFHQAGLTGESFAASLQVGQPVVAGSYLIDATVELTATAGTDSLEALRNAVMEGLGLEGTEQRAAARWLHWFVPMVGASALLAGYLHGWMAAMAVLVVACPCALGFATPTAAWAAMSRIRELGWLIRNANSLERLGEVDTIVFDKTGTLTVPEAYQLELTYSPEWTDRQAELLALIHTAESSSQHPVATALRQIPLPVDAPRFELSVLRILPGRGIEATVTPYTVRLEVSADSSHWVDVFVDNHLAARVRLEEDLRNGAAAIFAELSQMKLELCLATGDRASRASRIGLENTYASLKPLEKLDLMEQLRSGGHRALFLGDGLNDAAAMSRSHLSATLLHSPNLLQESADMILTNPSLTGLPTVIRIAREARKTIQGNLRLSVAYNVIGIALGIAGILDPVVASILMTASSIFVVLRSYRLLEAEPDA